MDGLSGGASVERYLERIGLDPATVLAGGAGGPPAADPDLETLTRLQLAHVTSVPFETLSITGDPHGDGGGEGVSLDPAALYRKVVERGRGGYCFELNGLFGRLLADLGFEPTRVAAMVTDDGEVSTPANHLTHLVALDRRYVVDVGMGAHAMRRPVPLDGDPVVDGAGVAWRIDESDRPDAALAARFRLPGEDDWRLRYVLDPTPRPMGYFAAPCEYLSTAPESPFTGDPVVTRSTPRGYLKLSPRALERWERGDSTVREVDPAEYRDLLDREFGIALPGPPAEG